MNTYGLSPIAGPDPTRLKKEASGASEGAKSQERPDVPKREEPQATAREEKDKSLAILKKIRGKLENTLKRLG